MAIKTIPLSRLEKTLQASLNECADTGEALVVELPDHRLLAIQALEGSPNDAIIDELIQSNPAFQQLLAKSKSSPRKPFLPQTAN